MIDSQLCSFIRGLPSGLNKTPNVDELETLVEFWNTHLQIIRCLHTPSAMPLDVMLLLSADGAPQVVEHVVAVLRAVEITVRSVQVGQPVA